MHQKRLAAGADGVAYSTPPDLLARFNSGNRDKGWRKGKRQEDYGQLREDWRTEEGKKGRKGRRGGKERDEKGRRNHAPRSLLKVGAYDLKTFDVGRDIAIICDLGHFKIAILMMMRMMVVMCVHDVVYTLCCVFLLT